MLQSFNPFTGNLIESYPEHSDREVEIIIENQSSRFKNWKKTDLNDRSKIIAQLGKILQKEQNNLARLITSEMGKPITESLAEVAKCAWLCEFYAENGAAMLQNNTIKTEAYSSYISFEPIGIIFAIMPWNFPLWQALRFAVPTILAGNVVLLKHAPNVSGTSLKLESIFQEAGFPENVFRSILIQADRSEYIIKHKSIRGVTITGSAKAGSSVASLSGKYLKKCVLELGGSDPFIVFEDADFPGCCQAAVDSRMMNSGQVCIAAKRFIVHESIFQEFVEAQKNALTSLNLGDPMQTKTQIGPMARPDLASQLQKQIDDSIALGAKLICGGKASKSHPSIFEPTLLVDIQKDMPVYKEETFGPLAIVIPFKTEEEAILIANDTDFGLGASIWTQDLNKAKRVIKAIDAGAVFVNSLTKSDPRLPFGGIKNSGIGRELSFYGITEFTNIKTNWIKA
ncbi:MAG: NAD-dependent succinate-semialdehyde dehydrogenase [Bacteroidales bacterium]|jgi:succinate-semialdehyde dehydrogenase/glutarate-semialdehyde dehydrogenase|nr:NAD-dependent succinate-semialdehyde dehydrogenase [Bacteroidales bacterium]